MVLWELDVTPLTSSLYCLVSLQFLMSDTFQLYHCCMIFDFTVNPETELTKSTLDEEAEPATR